MSGTGTTIQLRKNDSPVVSNYQTGNFASISIPLTLQLDEGDRIDMYLSTGVAGALDTSFGRLVSFTGWLDEEDIEL